MVLGDPGWPPDAPAALQALSQGLHGAAPTAHNPWASSPGLPSGRDFSATEGGLHCLLPASALRSAPIRMWSAEPSPPLHVCPWGPCCRRRLSVARMPREGASWGSPVPVVLPHPIGGRAVCPQTEHSREDLAQHGWPGTVVGQVTRLCQEDHVPYATARVGCGARLGGEPHRTSGWQRPLLRLTPVLQGTRA